MIINTWFVTEKREEHINISTKEDQLAILQQRSKAWNKWRRINYKEHIDLSKMDFNGIRLSMIDLRKADLRGTNFHGAHLNKAKFCNANLCEADLSEAILYKADLSLAYIDNANLRNANFERSNLMSAHLNGANLHRARFLEADLSISYLNGANLHEADLRNAKLSGAHLSRADLSRSNLSGTNLINADLSNANLSNADLRGAALVGTNLEGAILTGCKIYGTSAWGLKLNGAKQNDLIIASYDNHDITVDNLEVAQFIYLLLHNEKVRQIIETITSKVVLILGRFTPERKAVIDAIREELRKHNYLPVMFDFNKPASRDLTETISTLAHMARFIIADITEAKSIPAELQCIVPNLPSVPVMPLVLRSDGGYALFEHIIRYHWVLEPYEYESQEELIASISERIITPAEAKVKECRSS